MDLHHRPQPVILSFSQNGQNEIRSRSYPLRLRLLEQDFDEYRSLYLYEAVPYRRWMLSSVRQLPGALSNFMPRFWPDLTWLTVLQF
jgi:hypothetical protein